MNNQQLLKSLYTRMELLSLKEASDFSEALDRIQKRMMQKKPFDRDVSNISIRIDAAEAKMAKRVSSYPQVSYDTQLPVVQAKEEIAQAIQNHQVVVIAGETGSGKTTQIPKICLELGRGKRGLIGHTQPRRLAATSVAKRIASELSVVVGEQVGYAIRFDQACSDDSLIAVMTEGVLLQELKNDPMLWRYDTLIIDEAHERSLNIDLLLGYLKHLLPKRPELKLIITSATIDPLSFSKFFFDAPVLTVSGRTFPVDVWYQPLVTQDDESDLHLTEGVLRAVSSCRGHGPGDVMVFLSGEAEIREVAKHLRKAGWQDVDVLPLYARLSMSDQQRVFSPSSRMRIVLATNVAETSLTVPGIRYVIDSGKARISRYSQSSRVQRLPIENISRASAEQRKGRCGRVMSGVCIRLYDEQDFLTRDEFSTPEILRTNLSALLLQMLALGLKDIEQFDFIDSPDKKRIKDGLRLLEELGAIDESRQLLAIGRHMAQLPLPPQLSRILIAAHSFSCVTAAIIICAFLCIRDPRERPSEKADQAVGLHRRFQEPDSDFLSIIKLWTHVHQRKADLSSNQWRKELKTEFLNVMAVVEWGRLVAQLKKMCQEIGITAQTQGHAYEPLHRALLQGFIHQIGQATRENDYLGARNIRFVAHAGSTLHRKAKPWVMAADFIDGSRLFASHLAKIEPQWIEDAVPSLLKVSRSDAEWRERKGEAVVLEQISIFGLVLASNRATPLAKSQPEKAREFLVRHGLLRNEWDLVAPFQKHNQALLLEIQEQEERARKRDILRAEDDLVALLISRLPLKVYDKFSLIKALKRDKALDEKLWLTEEEVRNAGLISNEDYPSDLRVGELLLPLKYSFSPGEEHDGVTVQLTLPQLAQVKDQDFERLVPGFLAEKLEAMLRALPKEVRKILQPLNERVPDLLVQIKNNQATLASVIAEWFYQTFRNRLPDSAFERLELSPHLCMRYEIIDDRQAVIAVGRSVDALQRRLHQQKQQSVNAQVKALRIEKLECLPAEALPSIQESAGTTIHLGLKDNGAYVSFTGYALKEEAVWQHRRGIARLLTEQLRPDFQQFQRNNKPVQKMQMAITPIYPAKTLFDDWLMACVLDFLPEKVFDIRAQESFQVLLNDAPKQLRIRLADTAASITRILNTANQTLVACKALSKTCTEAAEDIADQVRYLVEEGFLTRKRIGQLSDLERYISAMAWRAERVPSNIPQDAQRMERWHDALNGADVLLAQSFPAWSNEYERQLALQRLLDEYSIALFAQHIKTSESVSEKRILQFVQGV